MHGFFPLHDGQRGLRTRLFLLLLEVNYIRCRLTVQNGKQHAMDEIMNVLFVKGFQKKKSSTFTFPDHTIWVFSSIVIIAIKRLFSQEKLMRFRNYPIV